MAIVYVLKSRRNGKRYIGCTSKRVEVRLKEHNSGSNQWTRQNGPFDLVYYEEFVCVKEARQRERFLKSGQGRKFLDKITSPVAQQVEQLAVKSSSRWKHRDEKPGEFREACTLNFL